MTQKLMTTPTAQYIADGYYTVVIGKEHRTFRLRTQEQDASFEPGKQIIAYLNGPSNESDYVQFGFVRDSRIFPWKRFTNGYDTIIAAARYLVAGNHETAGKMYAMQSGNCYRCGRVLTAPESIAAGLGPTCASRM